METKIRKIDKNQIDKNILREIYINFMKCKNYQKNKNIKDLSDKKI